MQADMRQRAGYKLRRDIEAVLGADLTGKQMREILTATEGYAATLARATFLRALVLLGSDTEEGKS